MTNYDKLKTRVLVAQSVGISPDDIRVMEDGEENNYTIYILDEFRGYNLVLGFNEVPTVEKAREQIKDLYLSGVEWDFDNEITNV